MNKTIEEKYTVNWKAILVDKMLKSGVSPKMTAEIALSVEKLFDQILITQRKEIDEAVGKLPTQFVAKEITDIIKPGDIIPGHEYVNKADVLAIINNTKEHE